MGKAVVATARREQYSRSSLNWERLRFPLSYLRRKTMARKYDPRASEEVRKTMHEYKHEHKFKNRKQAIAVGLSKARRKGKHVPKNK